METKPISEKQALIRLTIFVVVVFTVTLVATKSFMNHHVASQSPSPVSNTQSDLQVEAVSDNSSTNPQQTVNPSKASTNSTMQSGQANLQPAPNTAQLSGSLKQELGL